MSCDLNVYSSFEKFFIENHPNRNCIDFPSWWQINGESFKKYLSELYFDIYSFEWDEVINFFGMYEKIDYIYEFDLGYSKYWHMFISFLIYDKQISYAVILDLIKSTMNQQQMKLYNYPERLFYREINNDNRNSIKRKMNYIEPSDKRMKLN